MQQNTSFRRTLLAAVISGACLVLASPLAAAATGNTPHPVASKADAAEALAAAQRDFAQFVAHQLARKGAGPGDFPLAVTDLQELKQARIDYGFPVYTIDPPDLLGGRSNLRAMAKQAGEWRFVITVNQRAIGLATVEKNKGRFETVAYGAAVLAKDLDAAAGNYGNADKSNLRFLRIYQARADFLEVASEDGRGRFAPLHSARESLTMQKGAGKPGGELLDETEFLTPLRIAVKQNMAPAR